MLRWMAAALLIAMTAPIARAETDAGTKALAEAMASFFVVVPADAKTGNPVAEVRRDADGRNERTVVVAFIDAADAATQIGATGIGANAEGRILNAAELIALSGGEVIWRTSQANANIVNAPQTTPPAFYITNAAGEPLTQTVDGKSKVFFYLDAAAADAARVGIEKLMVGAGKTEKLSVVASDFTGLLGGIRSGDVKDVYFVSAPSVIRWADQWQSGARLIKDYKGL